MRRAQAAVAAIVEADALAAPRWQSLDRDIQSLPLLSQGWPSLWGRWRSQLLQALLPARLGC